MRYLDYSECTDEGIIELIHKGDRLAYAFLMKKFRPIVDSKARAMVIMGSDLEELQKKGMAGVHKAIWRYSTEQTISFGVFADIYINQEMNQEIYTASLNGKQPRDPYLALYLSNDRQPGRSIYSQVQEEQQAFWEEQLETMIMDPDSMHTKKQDQERKVFMQGEVVELYTNGLFVHQNTADNKKNSKYMDESNEGTKLLLN